MPCRGGGEAGLGWAARHPLPAEYCLCWHRGGRLIRVRGTGLDVVLRPLLSVWLEAAAEVPAMGARSRDLTPRRSCGAPAAAPQTCTQLEGGLLQVRPHQQAAAPLCPGSEQGSPGSLSLALARCLAVLHHLLRQLVQPPPVPEPRGARRF